MTLRRGIVQGYDTGLAAPKGVAGAIDIRQSVAAVAQRTGVYWDRDDPCTATGTATMNVNITGFRAAIESPLGGFYVVTADDTESVAIAASDSTNARYDIIYVDQEDYQVDGSQVDSEAVLTPATGTPALTPTDPSIPSTAVALYRVEVPAGVTTTNAVGVVLTPLFDYTAPVGAPIPVRTYTEMDAITEYPGQRAKLLAITSQPVYEWDGTEWRSVDTIVVADSTERGNLSKQRTGDLAFTVSDGITYRWNGSAWNAWESEWITYTPTVSASSGAIGAITSQYAKYKYSAGAVVWIYGAQIAVGTGTGYLKISVPVNVDSESTGSGLNVSIGTQLAALVSATDEVRVYKYDGSFPISGNHFIRVFSLFPVA